MPRAIAGVVAVVFAAAAGSVAHAQAWVSPQGEGYVQLGYQYQWATRHLNAEGIASNRGTMLAQSLQLTGGFVPVPNLGLTLGLAGVATRWDRNGLLQPNGKPINPHGPHDDGNWHATVQDARLEVRYNVLSEPLLVTPLAGLVLPTHGYVTAGHAATGRHFVEAPVGLYAGRLLDPVLPDGWLQVRYAYSFVEHTVDMETGEALSTNRSNFDFDAGFFVTAELSVRFLGGFQWGHGGLDEEDIHFGAPSFDEHDRRLKASWQKLGGAATWSVGPFDLSLYGYVTLAGKNSANWATVAAVVSWNFGREAGGSFFGTRTRPAPR